MRFTLPSLFALALLAGLLRQPQPLYGQNKEIRAVQLDIYDLSKKIDDLKGGQSEKIAQMEVQLKQLIDVNLALSAELKALRDDARKNQADQERRVFAPLDAMKNEVSEISRGFLGIDPRLETMRKQQEETRTAIDDISKVVRLILTQTEQAPSPAQLSAAPASAEDTAALLFASAQTDRLTGNANFALQQFADISQKYPDSKYAPMAMFEVGSMYAANGEYDQALKAFDRVLEQFGENPMRKDAQFQKAEQLANLNRKADAVKEFNSFAKQYPSDDRKPLALSRAKELTAPAPAKPKAKSGKR